MNKIQFNSLNGVYNNIINDFNTNSQKMKIDLLYAFNGTGKTRLSRIFSELQEDKILCFNSMFQDEFIWNNNYSFLTIDKNSWIARFIRDQGLENTIEDNFQMFCDDTICPSIDLDLGIIEFSVRTTDGFEKIIKISKAEESIFIWTVFYTFIDSMIYELKEEKDNRSTDVFDNIEYIIIDDPVSSIDDIKIMNIAVKLYDLIEKINEIKNDKKPNILITTHHALFYNAIFNFFHRTKDRFKFKSFVLTKKKAIIFWKEKEILHLVIT